MILHKHKAVHIHISKCAGQSVERAFGQPIGQHHLKPAIIRSIGQGKWDDYYKFTFVRNPWDRLVSMYHYRRKHQRHLIKGRSFDAWIRQIFVEYHPKVHQHYWIADDGKLFVDFVGKVESMASDFDKVCRIIGAEASLPHVNKSKHEHYASYYDDETKELVRRECAQDIEMFGYTFEGGFSPAMVLR